MHKLPKKFKDRVGVNLKKYQRVAAQQLKNDVAEADTVTLIKDIFADILGFDKYNDLTSEFRIKGTFCDLAIKIDGKVKLLVEVKSAGSKLRDLDLRQVVDYGAHKGILWVVLTNGIEFRLVKISLAKQITHEEICRIHFAELNRHKEDDLQNLYLLSKEGLVKNAMEAFYEHAQIFNGYTVAATVKSDPVIAVIRRELRRLFPGLNIGPKVIAETLDSEVLKREAIDSEKANEAIKLIKRANQKLERKKAKGNS